MTFSQSLKTCLIQKYFTFSGRASRSEYWWFILFFFVVSFAVLFTTEALGFVFASDIVNWVLMALTTIPLYAAGARRLQDTGRSGWWQILVAPNVVIQALPQDISVDFYAAFYASDVLGLSTSAMWVLVLLLVLFSLMLLIWTIQRGMPGPNRYGDDPLEPESDADVFA